MILDPRTNVQMLKFGMYKLLTPSDISVSRYS